MSKKVLAHVLGVRSAIDLATPTGIDALKVFEFTVLRSPQTAQQLLQEAAGAVGALNESLIQEYGGLLFVTEDMFSFTRQGETTRQQTDKKAEYSAPDPKRSSLIGSMLPYEKYYDSLGWTPDYLVDAFPAQVAADIQFLTERWRNRFEFEVVKRMLTNTEIAIGSAGYSVPWAIGTSTNVNLTPPQYGAKVFDTTHTHFVVKNDSTGGIDYDDLIESMVDEMRHHGYRGRLSLLISENDAATVMALSRFSELVPQEVKFVGGNTGSPISFATGEYEGVPGDLVGYYRSLKGLVEVRVNLRFPTGYAFMTRPLGLNNSQNGLAVRVHPSRGFGLSFEPDIKNIYNPRLDKVDCEAWFGVGVNNRLNGVAGYIAAGAASWVNPTDSELGG
jgi:hypothetical protein